MKIVKMTTEWLNRFKYRHPLVAAYLLCIAGVMALGVSLWLAVIVDHLLFGDVMPQGGPSGAEIVYELVAAMISLVNAGFIIHWVMDYFDSMR